MGDSRVQVDGKSSSTLTPGFKPEESSFLKQRYQDRVEEETTSPTVEQQLSTSGQTTPTPPPSDPPPLSHSFGQISVLPIQAKLTIGQPNDKYEQEADRVAEQVMRMPEPGSPAAAITRPVIRPVLQRMCSECEEELQRQPMEEEEEEEEKEQTVQAKENLGQAPSVTLPLEARLNTSKGIDNALRGGGQPLSVTTRQFFEPRFGVNFSGVRVHTHSGAAQVSRSINAKAFTLGRDLVFGAGQYSPNTTEGKKLLAHELTHIIQQGGGIQPTNHKSQKPLVQRNSDIKIMREGFESTIKICHRVLFSRKFKVTKGGLRVVLLLKEIDKNIPICQDFAFWVTLTQSIDWWPDDEIGTCRADTGGVRSFSFANLSSGTYYLTIYRIFDHPYCCLEGDILVFDEAVSSDSAGCKRDKDPSVLDIVHGALDIAGFFPVLGAIPDGVNALIYVAEGDWTNAGISAVAMVPAFGDGAKLAIKGGKEVIEASGKTIIKEGKEKLATRLAAKKAEKEAAKEKAAKKAAEEKAAQETAEKAAKEKAAKESSEQTGKKGKKEEKKEKRKKTCATEFPVAINCDRLPRGYIYSSPQAALKVLKASTGISNLKIVSPQITTRGPCPGIGMHYGVKSGREYIASIVCCPCCKDTSTGPKMMNRCKIV